MSKKIKKHNRKLTTDTDRQTVDQRVTKLNSIPSVISASVTSIIMKWQVAILLIVAWFSKSSIAFDWTLETAGNTYVSFTSTLTVPPVPDYQMNGANQPATYFLWPGLQPNSNSANLLPINNGVLQPVLSYGPACSPGAPKQQAAYNGWYISAQYVNTNTQQSGFSGCLGGSM